MKGLGLRGNLGSKILDPQILKPVQVGPAASITTGLALSLSLSGPQVRSRGLGHRASTLSNVGNPWNKSAGSVRW